MSAASEAMLGVVLGRLNKDGSESKLVNAGLITLSADAGATIATSIGTVVSTLMPLVDKANASSSTQSAFAAKLEAVSGDILESYSLIAKANAALASQP